MVPSLGARSDVKRTGSTCVFGYSNRLVKFGLRDEETDFYRAGSRPMETASVDLGAFFGYEIDRTARIGFSVICPGHLIMRGGARIGNLNVCKGLEFLILDENATIGNVNWISGYPKSEHDSFASDVNRAPELIMVEHAAITNRHLIDCTNAVRIGRFATMAGFRSQILTHSIDIERSCQSSRPVSIGDYSFIGTGSILLAGSAVPAYSVLGAGSVLNREYTEPYFLYAVVPARTVKQLSPSFGYFNRKVGYIR